MQHVTAVDILVQRLLDQVLRLIPGQHSHSAQKGKARSMVWFCEVNGEVLRGQWRGYARSMERFYEVKWNESDEAWIGYEV